MIFQYIIAIFILLICSVNVYCGSFIFQVYYPFLEYYITCVNDIIKWIYLTPRNHKCAVQETAVTSTEISIPHS